VCCSAEAFLLRRAGGLACSPGWRREQISGAAGPGWDRMYRTRRQAALKLREGGPSDADLDKADADIMFNGKICLWKGWEELVERRQ
jgi:hypothetical protein